jgi:hypothetical protein
VARIVNYDLADIVQATRRQGLALNKSHKQRLLVALREVENTLWISSLKGAAPGLREAKDHARAIQKHILELSKLLATNPLCATIYPDPRLDVLARLAGGMGRFVKDMEKLFNVPKGKPKNGAKRGAPRRDWLRKLVSEVSEIYTEAGGKGVGSSKRRNGEPRGPLIDFTCDLLQGHAVVSRHTLHELIREVRPEVKYGRAEPRKELPAARIEKIWVRGIPVKFSRNGAGWTAQYEGVSAFGKTKEEAAEAFVQING